jgi:hypothetical protein
MSISSYIVAIQQLRGLTHKSDIAIQRTSLYTRYAADLRLSEQIRERIMHGPCALNGSSGHRSLLLYADSRIIQRHFLFIQLRPEVSLSKSLIS